MFPYPRNEPYSSGADDDGSGTVTILEAYRALLASEFRPVRNVEFHWYSAEVRRPSSYHKVLLYLTRFVGGWFTRFPSCGALLRG